MKKINLYIAGACLALGLASCDSFLDEENLSNVNSEQYFQEKDGYESLVNASYATLRSLWKMSLGCLTWVLTSTLVVRASW